MRFVKFNDKNSLFIPVLNVNEMRLLGKCDGFAKFLYFCRSINGLKRFIITIGYGIVERNCQFFG